MLRYRFFNFDTILTKNRDIDIHYYYYYYYYYYYLSQVKSSLIINFAAKMAEEPCENEISIILIPYTYTAHQTIKLSLMRCMRILTEQECFKARLNEVMETEFRTL